MKKFLIFISLVIIFATVVWIFSGRIESTAPGLSGPPRLLEAANSSTQLSTSDLKGKYVLVNFWDSHNAVSRIAAGEYDRYFRNKTYPEGGYSSYLLNPSGKIVAVNPTVQAINRIINSHGK